MEIRAKAKELLLHYFDLTGVVNDNDKCAEIEYIVNCVINDEKKEMKEEYKA